MRREVKERVRRNKLLRSVPGMKREAREIEGALRDAIYAYLISTEVWSTEEVIAIIMEKAYDRT